jgi:histidinol-phosphatase (PHP family)
MVASAKAKGLAKYSITEHVSQFKEPRESLRFGSLHSRGRIFRDLKEYRSEFSKIDPPPGLTIRRGLEVDYSPRFEAQVGNFVNQEKWDILLCSVHEFEDGRDIERRPSGPVDKDWAEKHWRDYLRLQRLALESDFVPYQVLSHPVRMARSIGNVPSDLDDLLLDLANMARRRGKALELNGNDVEYAPGLVRRLATACAKAGCRVSLGSDAHQPNKVYRNVQFAASLVEEMNLQTI